MGDEFIRYEKEQMVHALVDELWKKDFIRFDECQNERLNALEIRATLGVVSPKDVPVVG